MKEKDVKPEDIKRVVNDVKNVLGAGERSKVQTPFKVSGKEIPQTKPGAWGAARLKFIKLKKIKATNAQLDRENLIWHVQHPGKGLYKTPHDTHPQVMKTKDGNKIIIDGHHRLSALKLLGVKKTAVFLLKEKDFK